MRMIRLLEGVAALAVLTCPALGQQSPQTTYRDSGGRTIGTATTDSQGSVTYRDSGGRTTGTSSRDGQGTTTYRDSGGRVTGSASGRGRGCHDLSNKQV